MTFFQSSFRSKNVDRICGHMRLLCPHRTSAIICSYIRTCRLINNPVSCANDTSLICHLKINSLQFTNILLLYLFEVKTSQNKATLNNLYTTETSFFSSV